jgi:hypothetical protein
MRTDIIKLDLLRFGIDPENYRVLKLLPLVFVAWADGVIEPIERDRLFWLARFRFGVGTAGERVLEDWLRDPPAYSYVRRGMRHLLALALAPDEFELEPEDLRDLLADAELIARTTGAAPDSPWAMKPAEERALREVSTALHVDNGSTWTALLRELDSSVLHEAPLNRVNC